MRECRTCGLPYQVGRYHRHVTTFSHRAALAGDRAQANPAADAAAADQGDQDPAPRESFGQRMARIRREKNGASS